MSRGVNAGKRIANDQKQHAYWLSGSVVRNSKPSTTAHTLHSAGKTVGYKSKTRYIENQFSWVTEILFHSAWYGCLILVWASHWYTDEWFLNHFWSRFFWLIWYPIHTDIFNLNLYLLVYRIQPERKQQSAFYFVDTFSYVRFYWKYRMLQEQNKSMIQFFVLYELKFIRNRIILFPWFY